MKIPEVEKNIDNLKRQFISPTFRGQQHKSFSPNQVSGAVSVSFYRGQQQGVYDTYLFLKDEFPEAAKEVFSTLLYESGREQ